MSTCTLSLKRTDDIAVHDNPGNPDTFADVIRHIAHTEGRSEQDVAREVTELARRYKNVMQQDLMRLGRYSTQDRVSAVICMRHYMRDDADRDDAPIAARVT